MLFDALDEYEEKSHGRPLARLLLRRYAAGEGQRHARARADDLR
jgi:hypothetical protein